VADIDVSGVPWRGVLKIRIDRVREEGFLSLGMLDLARDVILGPNGSGKRNIVHLFWVIRDTAGWPSGAAAGRNDLALYRRVGANSGFPISNRCPVHRGQ
jgi:hypothetical protein